MKNTKLILPLAVFATSIGIAFANVDEDVKNRQLCMKNAGEFMKLAAPMAKGEKPYEPVSLTEQIAITEQTCKDLLNYFASPDIPTVKTRARPEIWTDRAGFEKENTAFQEALAKVKTQTDVVKFSMAFGAFGASCSGCHQSYRAPEN